MGIVSTDWMPAIRNVEPDIAVCAIGDVHGRADLLDEIHWAITKEFELISPTAAHCIHLGDLIDRGPESKRALELAMRGIPGAGNYMLLGNHEHRLLQMLDEVDEKKMERWLKNGGLEFFEELRVDPHSRWDHLIYDRLGREIEWLRSSPLKVQIGKLLFVHAGIDVDTPIFRQGADTLVWIREPWLSSTGPYEGGVAVIHGHTPVADVALNNPDRINLDTGACETGILTALVVAGSRMKLLQTRS